MFQNKNHKFQLVFHNFRLSAHSPTSWNFMGEDNLHPIHIPDGKGPDQESTSRYCHTNEHFAHSKKKNYLHLHW